MTPDTPLDARALDSLIGPFASVESVAGRLGITLDDVTSRATQRQILRVISADGLDLYPLWQFDGDRLVAGLAEVLAFFPEDAVDGWTLAAWLRTPEPELGESPVDGLLRGAAASVKVAARTAARSLVA